MAHERGGKPGRSGLNASVALAAGLVLCPWLAGSAAVAERPPGSRVTKQAAMDLALRVETAEGAFVVFDAVTPEGDLRAGPAYLAYWHDASAAEVYVFDRPLRTPADVGRALIDLSRDFVVDVDAITAGAEWLPDARAAGDDRSAEGAVWLVATRNSVLQAMGFEPIVPAEEDLPMTMSAAATCGMCKFPYESTLPDGGVPWDAHRVQRTDGGIVPAFPDGVNAEVSPLEMVDRTLAAIACPPHYWWCACCGTGCTACCGSTNPCCGKSCGDGNDCTTDGCNEGGCWHYQADPCCGDPDPCCDNTHYCCGNSNRCCRSDNPCCDSPDPCCNANDSCCGDSDRCCNADNPCCGSENPCCNADDGCCGDSDRCCNADNPCCGSPDPCCNPDDGGCASNDPCFNEDNPCCENTDPCDPVCGDPCACCDDGDACTTDSCVDGVCDHSPSCSAEQKCCPNGECCNEPCEGCLDSGSLSGGTIDVTPSVVCLGGTIAFTLSGVIDSGGVKRVECSAKEPIAAVEPSYEWTLTLPPDYPPPLPPLSGSGAVATVVALGPGAYSCAFAADADRDCPPESIEIGPATRTLVFSATLSADPGKIPAKTACPTIPDFSYSEITVQWDPPECEGTLEIVEVIPDEMYLPSGDGTLDRIDATKWRYTAFDESPAEKRPKGVVVWIAAKQGVQELTRVAVWVRPTFKWWVSGHEHGPGAGMHTPTTADYMNAYLYAAWKYSPCFPGGSAFASVSIASTPLVSCPTGHFTSVDATACTDASNNVVFGESTFTRGENVAASVVGHELDHTVGADECQALTWEFDNVTCTLIGATYFSQLLQDKSAACGE